MANNCIICGQPGIKCDDLDQVYDCECSHCGGKFKITEAVIDKLHDYPNMKYQVASFITEMNLRQKDKPSHRMAVPTIFDDRKNAPNNLKDVYDLEEILAHFPKTVKDKLDRILLNLYYSSPTPGSSVRIPGDYIHKNLSIPLLYSQDSKEAFFYLGALSEKRYLKYPATISDFLDITLLAEGFNRVYDIELRAEQFSRQVFVALDFDCRGIYDNAIRGFLESKGFEPICMLDHKKSDNIDDAIFAGIMKSRFVIADLTLMNRGAYWEAGLARGLGKTVILCCKNEKDKMPSELVHFDLNHFNILFYDDLEELKKELHDRMVVEHLIT